MPTFRSALLINPVFQTEVLHSITRMVATMKRGAKPDVVRTCALSGTPIVVCQTEPITGTEPRATCADTAGGIGRRFPIDRLSPSRATAAKNRDAGRKRCANSAQRQ